MSFWNGKRVCVTGGAGFLGAYVVETLRVRERGCGEVFVPRSEDYDLVQLPAVQKLYADSRPDIVIHPSTPPSTRFASGRWLRAGLAARVGGIPLRCPVRSAQGLRASGTDVGANREHPAEFFGTCPELAEGTILWHSLRSQDRPDGTCTPAWP